MYYALRPRPTEALSPDGKNIAIERTSATGWFGMGSIETTVKLGDPTAFLSNSFEVLVFFNRPQGVEMKWLSPTQLELTYRTPRPPGFEPEYQVVRFGEIDVLVKENLGPPTK